MELITQRDSKKVVFRSPTSLRSRGSVAPHNLCDEPLPTDDVILAIPIQIMFATHKFFIRARHQ